MNILTIVYLFYILVSLYFSIVTLMIYFKNKNRFFDDSLEDYTPGLSVIIPAYNEEKTIADTLNAVLASDYPKDKLEVIVVDDGSKDRTSEIVKGFKDVKLLSKSNSGKADSVNKAIEISKGELIAIVDADAYPETDSFRKMSRYFANENIGAVTGTILVRNRRNLIEKCQAMEYTLIAWSRRLLDFLDSVFVTPGALSMYRKSALKKVGGFDKSMLTEDIEIAWNLLRNKYKIKMEPIAHSFTSVPNNLKSWWRQRIRWDVGGFQTLKKHRKILFKTNYNMFGIFIIPFFLSHIILSFAGFFVLIGVLLSKFFNWLLYAKYSVAVGENIVKSPEIYILPNVLTVFGILLILIFLWGILLSLNTMKKANIKIDFAFIIYSLFYLATFPILLIISLYKWARGYSQW